DLGVLGVLAELGAVEAALVFEELGAHLVSGPVLWSALAASFVDGVAGGDVRVSGAAVDDRTDVPTVVEHADECDVLGVLHDDRVVLAQHSGLPPRVESAPLDPLTPVAAFATVPDGEVVGDAHLAQ